MQVLHKYWVYSQVMCDLGATQNITSTKIKPNENLLDYSRDTAKVRVVREVLK